MDYTCTNCGFALEFEGIELICSFCGIFHSYDDFTTCAVCEKIVNDWVFCSKCNQNKCYKCSSFKLKCDGECGNMLICNSCDNFTRPHFCEFCQETKKRISIRNQEISNELRQILNSDLDIQRIKHLAKELV